MSVLYIEMRSISSAASAMDSKTRSTLVVAAPLVPGTSIEELAMTNGEPGGTRLRFFRIVLLTNMYWDSTYVNRRHIIVRRGDLQNPDFSDSRDAVYMALAMLSYPRSACCSSGVRSSADLFIADIFSKNVGFLGFMGPSARAIKFSH